MISVSNMGLIPAKKRVSDQVSLHLKACMNNLSDLEKLFYTLKV